MGEVGWVRAKAATNRLPAGALASGAEEARGAPPDSHSWDAARVGRPAKPPRTARSGLQVAAGCRFARPKHEPEAGARPGPLEMPAAPASISCEERASADGAEACQNRKSTLWWPERCRQLTFLPFPFWHIGWGVQACLERSLHRTRVASRPSGRLGGRFVGRLYESSRSARALLVPACTSIFFGRR